MQQQQITLGTAMSIGMTIAPGDSHNQYFEVTAVRGVRFASCALGAGYIGLTGEEKLPDVKKALDRGRAGGLAKAVTATLMNKYPWLGRRVNLSPKLERYVTDHFGITDSGGVSAFALLTRLYDEEKIAKGEIVTMLKALNL